MNREWWENTQNKTNIRHKLKRTTHSFFIFQWKRDMIPLREENEETEERRERCTNWQGGKEKKVFTTEIAYEYRGHDTHRHTHSEREKERKRWEMGDENDNHIIRAVPGKKRTTTTSTRWKRRERKKPLLGKCGYLSWRRAYSSILTRFIRSTLELSMPRFSPSRNAIRA